MGKKCESVLDFIINSQLKFGDKVTNGISTWVISYSGSRPRNNLADRKLTWLKGWGNKGNIGYGDTSVLASIYMDNLDIYRPTYTAYKAVFVNKNNDLEISKHYFITKAGAIQYLTNRTKDDSGIVQLIDLNSIMVYKKKDVVIYTLKDKL